MSKHVIAGDLSVSGNNQITGNNQVNGNCVVAGDTLLTGLVEAVGSLEVGGTVTANTVVADVVSAGSGKLLVTSGTFIAIPDVTALISSPATRIQSAGNVVLAIDTDNNTENAALYVLKNTNSGAIQEDTTLLKLEENGNLTLGGTVTANTVVADVVSAGSGKLLVTSSTFIAMPDVAALISSPATRIQSTGNVVLAIDTDNSSTNAALYVLKNTNSGAIQEDTTLLKLEENGNLFISGSYSPFTGAHVYPATEDLSAHVGSALVLVDGERVALASQPNSRNVAGILISCTEKSGDSTRSSLGPIAESFGYVCQVAAVGDSRSGDLLGVNICNLGGEVVAGDLLVTSSRPGYLMKQEDDIIRSSTVAKAMQPVNFSDDGVATGVYAYVYCG